MSLTGLSADGTLAMKQCPKCESTKIIYDGMMLDLGHHNITKHAKVAVHSNPKAWSFKGMVTGTLRATVCGACGVTELYVSEPAELYEAFRSAQQNK